MTYTTRPTPRPYWSDSIEKSLSMARTFFTRGLAFLLASML